MNYLRICSGVHDKGKLVTEDTIYDYVTDFNKDWYSSVFYYNDAQYSEFQKTGSVKGVKDVRTKKLVFDFDYKTDPDVALSDVRILSKKFTTLGINQKDIELYFSGNKGLNLVLNLDREITPEQAYELAHKYAGELKTLDSSLYDAPQILRIGGTKHNISGLFKIPLSYQQIHSLNIAQIKQLAISVPDQDFDWSTISVPSSFYDVPKKEKKVTTNTAGVDWTTKPNNWRNCKWAIRQGFFGDNPGERHEALLVLAATCRATGYDKNETYYLCKSALKKQSARTGREDFPKEELWGNIISDTIFQDGWEGGQFTCKKPGWLQKYCEKLGDHQCSADSEDKPTISIEEMNKVFTDYAVNFEQNIVKTGINELDNNIMFLSSTHNGILGQPGSGKTSFALEWLHHASLNDIQCTFLSLDMGVPIIFAKIIQKLTGLTFKEVMHTFKDNPKQAAEWVEVIKDEYKNVGFNFKAGLTVPDIKKIIIDQQETTGRKTKLLVTDYLECVQGPFSDMNANAGFVSQQFKDLANEVQVCSALLLQTQKHSVSDIADPLLSMKQIKGSSVIEQSCSVVMTLWREGYNPNTVNDDRYISFAGVKNRFGSLWKEDFAWEGKRGSIRELAEEEKYELADFRKRKIEMKMKETAEKNGQWE